MHNRISLPPARGPLSRWLLDRMQQRPVGDPGLLPVAGRGFDADLQLALYLCFESHYSELPATDVDWEWDPTLITFRRMLKGAFEEALREVVDGGPEHGSIRELLPDVVAADSGPSLSRHMESSGTLDQMRQFVIHRSPYQLKEGDAHTFAIPRLRGRAKQLLVEIQAGEYGADAPGRVMHSELFAGTMRALGLDDRRHAYLDVLPASALMVSNLISMFGLHRRWRGALVGHLAVFEMTSVTPMGRYARGLTRMGAPAAARRFYEVHILADAEHELMALDMVEALAADEPALVPDILFGARCVNAVEAMFANELLRSWQPAIPLAPVAA